MKEQQLNKTFGTIVAAYKYLNLRVRKAIKNVFKTYNKPKSNANSGISQRQKIITGSPCQEDQKKFIDEGGNSQLYTRSGKDGEPKCEDKADNP